MIVLVNDEYSLEKAKEVFPDAVEYRLVEQTDKDIRKTQNEMLKHNQRCVVYKTKPPIEFKVKNYCFAPEYKRTHLTNG